MSSGHVDALDTSMQKTNEWLRDLAQELGGQDRHQAYLALRATLHALRDRLTVEQSAHLAAQLPLVVRGLYFEGWRPADVPQKHRTREALLDSVREELADAPPALREHADDVTTATLRVLSRYVDTGEVQKLQDSLPKPLRSLWPQFA